VARSGCSRSSDGRVTAELAKIAEKIAEEDAVTLHSRRQKITTKRTKETKDTKTIVTLTKSGRRNANETLEDVCVAPAVFASEARFAGPVARILCALSALCG
jgi:hypothetical protein